MKHSDQQDVLFEPQASDSPEFQSSQTTAPLAERCRPTTLEEFIGQEDILGEDKPLRKAIMRDKVPSMILWGPPGSGKTTLARLLARLTKAQFLTLSATQSGIKDFRKIIELAKKTHKHENKKNILFIDEIHRWNKSQQDALLPHVESGLLTLIGATTENPSFEVNGALLSRVTVFTLSSLDSEDLKQILQQGINQLEKEGNIIKTEDDALEAIIRVSHGDARVALNTLEQVIEYAADEQNHFHLTNDLTMKAIQEKRILYDKSGEEHYNLISALHKSMRDSDPQGTLYWLARMIEGGEDPLYIARRIVRFATEDVGLADPNGLLLAIAARDTYHFLGSPEGELALAEAAVYLACAPKSNAIYTAFNQARTAVKQYGYLPVPMHIRNAPTKLMKEIGYGKGYQYAHDHENAITDQEHLPGKLKGTIFYEPTDRGREKQIKERLDTWQKLMEEKKNKS